MSPKRWALSVFFVWHVLAIGIGSLASPGAVLPVGPPRHPVNDPIAATMTPALDRVAAVASRVLPVLTRILRPVRPVATSYLETTGVAQSWKMFSNPPEVLQYIRIRYYVGAAGSAWAQTAGPAWTATELVLPAHREDEVRFFRAYWDAFRDKAMTSALQRFHEGRSSSLIKADTTSSDLPSDLAPIGRYFARRFEREALRADERILRTEVWYGFVPMPAPRVTPNRATTEARLAVLRLYYQGPVENHFGRPRYPVYHVGEQQADILWLLEYFEP